MRVDFAVNCEKSFAITRNMIYMVNTDPTENMVFSINLFSTPRAVANAKYRVAPSEDAGLSIQLLKLERSIDEME